MSRGQRVLVAGAGAFGTATALELARGGAEVVLADPAGIGDNASGAAAGMLAPAFEALLDPTSAGHFGFLAAARDLWPDLLAGIGPQAVGLTRGGARWVVLADDPPGLAETRQAGLAALGAGVEDAPGGGFFTPEDWRLAPSLALPALQAAARGAGARTAQASVTAFEPGRAVLSTGEAVQADALVVATGAEPAALAPELAVLSPIKGHILRFAPGGPLAGEATLRCRLGYATGGADGLCVGATMEAGLADRALDPEKVEALRRLAAALSPPLAAAPFAALAGVRATTPDGLPLVGPSERRDVFLAAGARRNGWLLAPLVARMTAAYLAGRDPGPEAARLDARRFASA